MRRTGIVLWVGAAVLGAASGAFAATPDTTPPAMHVAAQQSLTAVRVAFSEPVRGVTTTSLRLLAVSGGNIAVTLRCVTTTGAAASCANGPARAVTMRPSTPLRPGEYYRVVANASSAVLRDMAGNPVPRTPEGRFRGALRVEENSPAIHYTWRRVDTAAALGGSLVTEHLKGATAAYRFNGPSVTLYFAQGPDQGTADLVVDGVVKRTVDNYAGTRRDQRPTTVGGLGAGWHLVVVRVLGTGSPAATGTFVSLDGARVGNGAVDPDPGLRFTWRVDASQSGYAVADQLHARASLRFRGTQLQWLVVLEPKGGQAEFFIDGVSQGLLEFYAATPSVAYYTTPALTDGVHTFRIDVFGHHAKAAGSTGTEVTIGHFQVH